MLANVIPFIVFVLYFWGQSQLDTFPIKVPLTPKRGILLFSLCALMVFAGCRWSSCEVGYDYAIFDYSTYKNVYLSPLNILNFFQEYASSDYEIRSLEPGYIFYSSLCYWLFGNHYNLYLLFTNCLLVLIFYKGLKNNEIKHAYFYLLFFFAARLYLQYNFILMRQGIALAIVWTWGFPLLIKGKYTKFFLVVASASTFHVTALITLLAPLFKYKFKIGLFIIGTIVFILLSATGIFDQLFVSLIERCLSAIGLPNELEYKLSQYISGDEFRKLNAMTFIEAIPFGYIAIKYKKKLCDTSWGRFYHNMFYVFILLLAITMNFGFLTRACQYFMFSYFYLLAFYFQVAKRNAMKSCFLFMLSCYFLLYSVRYIFIWFYTGNYSFFPLKI